MSNQRADQQQIDEIFVQESPRQIVDEPQLLDSEQLSFHSFAGEEDGAGEIDVYESYEWKQYSDPLIRNVNIVENDDVKDLRQAKDCNYFKYVLNQMQGASHPALQQQQWIQGCAKTWKWI